MTERIKNSKPYIDQEVLLTRGSVNRDQEIDLYGPTQNQGPIKGSLDAEEERKVSRGK